MGNKIADIKVGLPSRRMTKHTMDYSANLTMNFGEVNSLGFLEMDGNTKAKGSIKSLVRMSPLPLPTFGELSYKTYARFIPIKDIYRNFENLRGARSLTTQFGTFTPTSVPVMTIKELSIFILQNFCKFSVYTDYETVPTVTSTDSNEVTYQDLFLMDPTEEDHNNRILDVIPSFNSYIGTSVIPLTYLNDKLYNTNITPNNADFIQGVSTETDAETGGYVICFRLTRLGKVLYRNLLSLGYNFDLLNTSNVSVLPILAFYKGYYDLFVPANTANSNRNFTDTYCFRVCDYCAEHDTKNVFNSDANIYPLWKSFLTEEFSKVFYYQDPDFITSMIASPSISPATAPLVNDINSLSILNSSFSSATTTANTQPTLSLYSGNNTARTSLSALNIKLALRLLPYVNKDTIIGGKLRELIKSRFGYDVETLEGETYTAGRYNLPIQISALTNSADTQSSDGSSGQVLGQQGGLGVAYTKDECLRYNFKAKEYGFLMFYSVIVPKAGFFQGINPALKHGTNGRFSLYDPAFDSLGFDLHTKDLILGENNVCSSPCENQFNSLNLGGVAFGFSPRYFDYKNKAHSIVSGDLARTCYREKYSPYYLDKLITPNRVEIDTNNVTQHIDVTFVDNRINIPTATPDLRQIGYQDWLENFNRIFYQYSLSNYTEDDDYSFTTSWISVFGVDDNFVADNLIACDYFDHSKPSSESFETDGEGKSMNVSHA